MAHSSVKMTTILFLLTHLPSLQMTIAIATQSSHFIPASDDNRPSLYHHQPTTADNNNNHHGLYRHQPIDAEPEQLPHHYLPMNPNYYNVDERNYDSDYYSSGGNSQPEGLTGTGFRGSHRHRRHFSHDDPGFQQQGMSDTRFLENGRYFYDVNTERFSSIHPYQSLGNFQATNEYSRRNYYENGYGRIRRGNSIAGHQNQDDQYIQDEQNYNMP